MAKFRDQYHAIGATARGWRLADPVEGLKKYLRRKDNPEEVRSEFDLTDEEMNDVLELLYKRVVPQRENSFAVHPPQKVLNDASILESDDVIEQLKGSTFLLVFQDGTIRRYSLKQLMAFVFNLIVYATRVEELERMVRAAGPEGPRNYEVSFQFSMRDIMTPEMVKALLRKVTFSKSPSE